MTWKNVVLKFKNESLKSQHILSNNIFFFTANNIEYKWKSVHSQHVDRRRKLSKMQNVQCFLFKNYKQSPK